MQYRSSAFLYDFSSKVFNALMRGFGAAVVKHTSGNEFGILYRVEENEMIYTAIRSWKVIKWESPEQYKRCKIEDFWVHYDVLDEVRSMREYGKRIQMNWHTSEAFSEQRYDELANTEPFKKSIKRLKKNINGHYSTPEAVRNLPDPEKINRK